MMNKISNVTRFQRHNNGMTDNKLALIILVVVTIFSCSCENALAATSQLPRNNLRRQVPQPKGSSYGGRGGDGRDDNFSSSSRQLKGTKTSKSEEPTLAPSLSLSPSQFEHSCTNLAEYYMCDENKIAICYVHDDHYHNVCVDMDDEDVLNKVPGVDLYKDKYELLNCGCCPEGDLHNNLVTEIKYYIVVCVSNVCLR